jgi:transcription elongation factor Elf1
MCDFHDEDETYICSSCETSFQASDFDDVDDEFDASDPQCVNCQRHSRIEGETCEFCDLPAEYETESFYLCGDHYDDYVDGYRRD